MTSESFHIFINSGQLYSVVWKSFDPSVRQKQTGSYNYFDHHMDGEPQILLQLKLQLVKQTATIVLSFEL